MSTPHLLETLLDSPIAFHRVFAELTESVTAGLMLSQAIYWSKRTKDPDGWFYKSRDEWFAETYLQRRAQENARSILRKQRFGLPSFWQEDLRGVPARLFFRIDFNLLFKHLHQLNLQMAQHVPTETTVEPDLTGVSSIPSSENVPTGRHETYQLAGTKRTNKSARKAPASRNEKAQHSITEITSETTPEITTSSTRARAKMTTTLPPLQKIYCDLTGNRWRRKDDHSAAKFLQEDPRKIELAIIETMLQTEQPKIHSFNYFVPRLQQWLSVNLSDETINNVLTDRRQKFHERISQ